MDEREVFSFWRVPAAPPGFAERVAASFTRIERRRRLRRRVVGLAAAAALLLVVPAAGLEWPDSGALDAGSRTTVALGGRAAAVAEAGSTLTWSVGLLGAVAVAQERGDVFYRVEPGRDFVVHAPHGTVRVTGTCLRVEVDAMNRAMVGAAAGSIVASVVWVTVYEGRVLAASGGAEREVQAGEQVLLRQGRAPELSPAIARAAPAEAPDAAAAPAAAPGVAVDASPAAWSAELARARAEVESLRRQVVAFERDGRRHKTYDLGPEELRAMAERCELRWDTPRVENDDHDRLSGDDIEELRIAPEEKERVEAVFARFNQAMLADLRRLYTEVTGETNVEDLSPESLFAEINDKSVKRDLQRVFQTLAEERAGLRTPPASSKGQPPIERLYRLYTGAGDRLQAEIAAEVGAERAQAIRDLHNGFGSKSRSSYGCP